MTADPRPGLVTVLSLIGALALLPLLGVADSVQHVVILACVWAMVASSWDLSLGYAGILNFAHVAFFGIGVYTYAIASTTFGCAPLTALALSGLAAGAAALAVTLAAMRVAGIYLLLATFAAAQIVMHVVLNRPDLTGGAAGIATLPALEVVGVPLQSDGKTAYYYAALVMLALLTLGLRRLALSDFGNAATALKENRDYAVARGISPGLQRLYVLVLSAVPTGLAGGFYATYTGVASPEVFGFGTLASVLTIVLVGGTSTITGPVLAAFAVTILLEATAGLGPLRYMILALVVVAVLRFFPGGLDAIVRRVWRRIHEGRDESADMAYEAQLVEAEDDRPRTRLRRRSANRGRSTVYADSEYGDDPVLDTRHPRPGTANGAS